jgi:GT2 family glycosyltransferase
MLLSAIVVSYNTRETTLECLRCLRGEMASIASEIIVVDNASTDGSAAAIRKDFPEATVLKNTENKGFGAANNQAMRQARGEFFLLINSDAFAKPGAIAAMLDAMRQRSDVAVVGPRLLNSDGTMQRSCFRFPSPGRAWAENLWLSAFVPNHWELADYRKWAHDRQREVDFVIGACFLVRRTVFEKIGGFDEKFFMYSEEVDWQKRMHEAGWKILFTPAAQVTHLAGASGAAEKPRVNRHFFQSLDYYELKHHGLFGLMMLRLAMVIGCSLRAAGWAACCLLPWRRESAWAKLKLRLWLIARQTTHWHLEQR